MFTKLNWGFLGQKEVSYQVQGLLSSIGASTVKWGDWHRTWGFKSVFCWLLAQWLPWANPLTLWTSVSFLHSRSNALSVCCEAKSVQFSSVAQSCPTLYDPMNCSTPGLPVHHQHLEFTQTLVHRVSDAIQPSHPLLSPSPAAPNPSQHQSLFQWVNSSHEVNKILEFQL